MSARTARLARSVAALLGGLVLATSVTGPAHAWTAAPAPFTTPGEVSLNGRTFQAVKDLLVCPTTSDECVVRARLSTPGFTVGASPVTAGEQDLRVTYSVQTRTPGQPWTTMEESSTLTSVVSSEATFTAPAWTSRYSYQATTSEVEYRIAVTVLWIDAATDFPIARADVVPSTITDTIGGGGDRVARLRPTMTGVLMSYDDDARPR